MAFLETEECFLLGCYAVLSGILTLLYLPFVVRLSIDLADGDNALLQNVGKHLPGCTAPYPSHRRENLKYFTNKTAFWIDTDDDFIAMFGNFALPNVMTL
jgi:hypothetical protein